jgi:hypothetical protein
MPRPRADSADPTSSTLEALQATVSAGRDVAEAQHWILYAQRHDRDLNRPEAVVVVNALRNARHHLATAEQACNHKVEQ